MNEFSSLGRIIVAVGIAIAIFGAVIWLFSRFSGGRGAPLPGDIVLRRDHITIYLPIISSIVFSIILTLVLWLISAFKR